MATGKAAVSIDFVVEAQQAIKSLRGLQGEVDKLKGKLEEQASAQVKATDKGSDALLGFAKKFVAAAATVKTLTAGIDAYFQRTALVTASAGANLDKLKQASAGLLTQNQLMSFSAQAMHGKWKLNQEEMERVLKGANALRTQFGQGLAPTVDKLAEAVSKGATEELKKFGIEAKDKTGLLAELDKKWREVGGSANVAGDGFRRASVNWKDSVDNLLVAIGKLVAALAPLIDLIAKGIGFVAQVAGGVADGVGTAVGGFSSRDVFGGPEWTARQKALYDARQRAARGELTPEEKASIQANNLANLRKQMGDLGAAKYIKGGSAGDLVADDALAVIKATTLDAQAREAAKHRLEKGIDGFYGAINGTLQAVTNYASRYNNRKKGVKAPSLNNDGDPLAFLFATGQAFSGGAQNLFAAGQESFKRDYQGFRPLTDDIDKGGSTLRELEALTAGYENVLALVEQGKLEGQESFLASIFGPIEEFNLYREGFQFLHDAALVAFDAWITGSKSLTQALKEFTANALKTLALELLSQSIRHAAYAVGQAAFGNFGQASMHAKAAVKFAAGAAVVGGLAKGMHGGGGGAASNAGSIAPPPGGYGSDSRDNRNQDSMRVVYIPNLLDKNPGAKAYEIQKELSHSRRYGGAGSKAIQQGLV